MGLLARIAHAGARSHIRHVAGSGADPSVAEVYEQAERDFGMVPPPIGLHASAPGALAAGWLILRETLLARGTAGRPLKEAAAIAVSRANACRYCVDVHTTVLHGLLPRREVTAHAEGRPIADAEARKAVAWALAAGADAVRPESPYPPGTEGFAELAGVVVAFHYLNRMVNVFLRDAPMPGAVPTAVRRAIGRIVQPAVAPGRKPGAALHLLPPAPLPADLTWAEGSPIVAQAFARAAAAYDEAGRRAVPGSVRDAVTAELDLWDGRPRGLSRAWVEEAAAGLPMADRAAGHLALLTAFASYQVGEGLIGDFRSGCPDDRTLIELTSWASFAAARRMGASWSSAPAVQTRNH